MTTLALLLLLLSALAPLLDRPLRRVVVDPSCRWRRWPPCCSRPLLPRRQPRTTATGWQRAAAAVLGVLVAVTAGSHVVRAVFRLTRREYRLVRAGRPAREPVEAAPAAPTAPAAGGTGEMELEAPGSVLKGGAWIGYLERGAVAGTLLAGFPEGLALVLAVKGVGRYSELRDSGRAGGLGSDAPEEFIIGTLASLLWAAAAAGTATLLR